MTHNDLYEFLFGLYRFFLNRYIPICYTLWNRTLELKLLWPLTKIKHLFTLINCSSGTICHSDFGCLHTYIPVRTDCSIQTINCFMGELLGLMRSGGWSQGSTSFAPPSNLLSLSSFLYSLLHLIWRMNWICSLLCIRYRYDSALKAFWLLRMLLKSTRF